MWNVMAVGCLSFGRLQLPPIPTLFNLLQQDVELSFAIEIASLLLPITPSRWQNAAAHLFSCCLLAKTCCCFKVLDNCSCCPSPYLLPFLLLLVMKIVVAVDGGHD
ncbi:hypothetical protein ACLOJK_034341 [Asimina triloba]